MKDLINELGLDMINTWKLAKLQKAEGLAKLMDMHIDKLKEIKKLMEEKENG
jgi:hypothetical protein